MALFSSRDVRVAGPRGRPGALSLVSIPLNYPKTTSIVLLWLCGLFFMYLSPPFVRTTPEMQEKFEQKYVEVYKIEDELTTAYVRFLSAKAYTDSAKVWFWRFRKEHREEVRMRQGPEKKAQAVVVELQQERDAKLSEAKSILGIWSDAGLQEGRGLFWSSYNTGKVFAQRETMMDALFSIMYSRESDTMGRIIELICIACVNFTTGMISALFIFMVKLPYMIAAFKPSWISGIVFYGLAFVGGASVVMTVLVLFYGGSITAIYALAGPELQTLQHQRRTQRRVRVGCNSSRPHYQ